MTAQQFALIRALVHRHTGIWIRDGKHVMLESRLSRRLHYHAMSSFSEYVSLLERGTDAAEIGEFINCVTTNKTSFFRESHHFEFLTSTILPEIQKAAKEGGPKNIRIWSAACSTGEEPYSIAMCLMDAVRQPAWNIEVEASDIDTTVLSTAANAIYDERSLDSVGSGLRDRYFLRGKGNMQGRIKVKREVTARVHFQRINLVDASWPVAGPFDAIFFRNALIYFNQDTQNLFLRRMLRSLKPQGYLFLGHSEHVPWLHDAVEPLSKTTYRLRCAA